MTACQPLPLGELAATWPLSAFHWSRQHWRPAPCSDLTQVFSTHLRYVFCYLLPFFPSTQPLFSETIFQINYFHTQNLRVSGSASGEIQNSWLMSLTFCGASGFYRFGGKNCVLGVVLSLLICGDLGSTNLLFYLFNPMRLPKHSTGFSVKSQLPPSILCFSFPI